MLHRPLDDPSTDHVILQQLVSGYQLLHSVGLLSKISTSTAIPDLANQLLESVHDVRKMTQQSSFLCVCVCVCEMSIRLGGCMSSSNVTFNWGGVFFPWQSLICVEGGTKTAQTLSPTAQITATKMLELSFCLGVQVSHIHWWLTLT